MHILFVVPYPPNMYSPSTRQRNTNRMAFPWWTDSGPPFMLAIDDDKGTYLDIKRRGPLLHNDHSIPKQFEMI